MNAPRSHYVTVLDREIHYMEWGERGAKPLIMWHGLARTGRDFDDIAQVLRDEYHIIVPDMIGRGLSQWSPQPDKEYCYEFYAALAQALLDEVGFDKVDWIGTSMGGATASAPRRDRSKAASGGLSSTTSDRKSPPPRSNASALTPASRRASIR